MRRHKCEPGVIAPWLIISQCLRCLWDFWLFFDQSVHSTWRCCLVNRCRHIECVGPNLSASNCSAVRTNEERSVTTSLKVKGRTEFLVRFLSFFLWVLINLYVAFTTLWAIVLFKNNVTVSVSFTPPCYKRGLVKTLIDRTFKINNMWLGFHNDIQNCLLFCTRISIPCMYWTCYSTITSRKQ